MSVGQMKIAAEGKQVKIVLVFEKAVVVVCVWGGGGLYKHCISFFS